MAFKAIFIGINEYVDLEIDNLEGARLDAKALHALFRDSVPGIDARLLLDGGATRAEIGRALEELFDGAAPDDTVLLTFAGHGSGDLGLVLHDSLLSAPQSMLSMGELAASFQRTTAKNVFVLLDCCESGEGPLRTLTSWNNASEIDAAFCSSEGGGRVMIAAANPLQAALESSLAKGHGLLTASLMEVLERAEGPLDVRVLAASISALVRAEALRLGEEQNTVDICLVAGGFTLPRLSRGPNYRAAFPDRVGTSVSGPFAELQTFGIPGPVTDVWTAAYPAGLNAMQLEAINDHRLLDGQSILVVAPTSSGKTLLGEMAALRAVAQGKRAVFLVPYRALASEQAATFTERYGLATGLRVIRCTGDQSDEVPQFIRAKYDVAVLTFEMFLSLALSSPTSLAHVGTVVADEAHFIADADRGITVELLLTLLVASGRGATGPQIVLSPR